MVYNIPSRTCRLIEIETLVRLADHSRIVAVKDAVDDLDFTRRRSRLCPTVFRSTRDPTADTRCCRMNGVGVVSVAAHLAGEKIKAMVEAATWGNDEEADHLNGLLGPLIAALFLEPNPMPLKAGLGMAWDPVGDPGFPSSPHPTTRGTHSRAQLGRIDERRERTCRLPRRPGEIGRNCATIEIDGRIAMVDAGLMFREEDMLGVDLVLPDYSIGDRSRRRISFVALTHGHEDHIGSLGYLLRERNVPVYGTALTVELAEARVSELGVDGASAVETGTWVEHGKFRFALSGHPSVPDVNRDRIRDTRGACRPHRRLQARSDPDRRRCHRPAELRWFRAPWRSAASGRLRRTRSAQVWWIRRDGGVRNSQNSSHEAEGRRRHRLFREPPASGPAIHRRGRGRWAEVRFPRALDASDQ